MDDKLFKKMELEIQRLKSENEALTSDCKQMGYQIDVMSDMTRIKIAASLLGPLLQEPGADVDMAMEEAVDMADKLVCYYEARMAAKAEQFHKDTMAEAAKQKAEAVKGGENAEGNTKAH